jgi:hypothetical protein
VSCCLDWIQSLAAGPGRVRSIGVMGHQNRKATPAEMEHAYRVIQEAFPDCTCVFGCHGDYHGHRAPRDHTIAFRIQDAKGKYRSNVVWLMPGWLKGLTAAKVRRLVEQSNGRS